MDFTFDERPSDSPLVEKVWRTHSAHAGTFISRAVSTWEMVVWRYNDETHLTVRGPETSARPTECPADAEFVGIQFKLGTFMPHLTTGGLVNNELVLPDAVCGSFWLHGTPWQFPDFENADTFVNRLVRADLLVRDPVVAAVLHDQPHDLSLRAVQYRFARATGLSHVTIQQIERAHRAAELLAGGMSIADTMFETGYFDQPHLTRSLKRLIGQTPAQIAHADPPA